MSRRWLNSKNPMIEARDRTARDERARIRDLHTSNLSTPTNRSLSDEVTLKQLEEGSNQPSEKVESFQSSPNHPQLITYRRERSQIET